LTVNWALELGPRKITVNSVAPGLTETDMTTDFPKEARQAVIGRTPLGRLGQGADIADVVAFLASDDARWVTGETITASGGLIG
jgi:3-oxoacyl-[acyl-carrier protein] reductase